MSDGQTCAIRQCIRVEHSNAEPMPIGSMTVSPI